MLKKVVATTVLSGALLTGFAVNFGFNDALTTNHVLAEKEPSEITGHSNQKVKNVIYMIPDGYNASYATNYRWFNGGELSAMDPHLKGMVQTYSANAKVTDSAAAGTAMATGVKTENGMIGVSPDGKELTSILDIAEDAKKSTGLVATSTITHATPAVFGASVNSRSNEVGIAPQYFENDIDVILGGGKKYFLPTSEGGKQEEQNLIEEAKKDGYKFVTDRDELLAVQGEQILGLFADDAMAPELDREVTSEPSLAEMTATAIDALTQNQNGFFLMVEGSQIDWAGHAHDAAWAMNDSMAFEEAVEEAISFAKKDGNTLVVIAGDHETGGMSSENVNVDALQNITATGNFMASKLNVDKSNILEVVKEYANINLKDAELEAIRNANNPANAINDVISKYVGIGWTTGSHTGVDVQVYAYGPQSDKFVGLHENTDLPRLIAEAMKLKMKNE